MAAVVAQPHFIFGLRTNVTNNVSFCDEETVVFPCGNNCVTYNSAQDSQRFIPVSDRSPGLRALTISANRRYLAASESGERATITVFDLQHEQGRKRKVLTPGDVPVLEFICIDFSPDNKYLIGQTTGPEWVLILWLWEKQKVLSTVTTGSSNNPVTRVSFNPFNNTQVCVSGSGVLKLFRYAEGSLKQTSFPKVESVNFLCHAWLTQERVVAGTDSGRLLIFESGELRKEINLSNAAGQERVDRPVEMKRMKEADVDERSSQLRVTALTPLSKGFACSAGPGTVSLFERTKDDGYRKRQDILIVSDTLGAELVPAESQEIHSLCVSPAEETMVISTDRGQLYSVSLSSSHKNKEGQVHFEFLTQPFHSKPITGLSTCLRKPIVATCSLDRSVRIWDYENKSLELYKEFQEEAYSVSLHPTGHFILVGFSDRLRLMNLLVDDIRTVKEFAVRGCRECAFSHGGHMFAAVGGNVISIYSVTSFENIINLKGHNGKVRGIEWGPDDRRLVSCGMDGAVYEWNTQTGKRESESVIKTCSYTDMSLSSDFKTIIAVGTDHTLKEIQDCQVLREVPADEVAHCAVAVSRTGRVVFTGTSSGAIRAVKYPLPTQKEWVMYQAHSASVTKMLITLDEQFLVTVSEDGCMLISKIIDKEGRRLKTNRQIIHTEEVLVTKSDLEEKNQTMLELKMRLEEMQMENEYQLRLKDINYNEKIKELTEGFTQQIQSLQETQQVLKSEMEKQELEYLGNSAEALEKHSKEVKDLEVSYSEKLIVEHERFMDLQREFERMTQDYELKLKEAAERNCQSLEEQRRRYEAQLQERSDLLAQTEEQAKEQIEDYKEMIKQIEEDEEKTVHEMQIQYEKKLHTEKEANKNLKGETGILTQKFYSLQRQIDDRNNDINALKQERQDLQGLVRSQEGDISDLKRKISGLEKTNQNKDNTISTLKKKNQDLEKLKFVLEFRINELENQTGPQQEEIQAQKEKIQKLEDELQQIGKLNAHLKLTTSQLRLRLRTKDKEMHKEMQKMKDLETHLQRLKSELHVCAGFIQEPKKLKDCVQMIYSRYVQPSDTVDKSSFEEEIQQVFGLHQRHLERTVASLKLRLAKTAEEHEKTYTKLMKENVSLIGEINELRKELITLKSRGKTTGKKSSRSRPSSGPTEKTPCGDPVLNV
ncbi:cilia- and flagella-associated protein 57 [Periophthalmus magnuspinnatus]|uniref:cilia- and flagella-associated protein 57 n=1 Tax=Periophthalmus magnuspinnatus TaxID=409849 RepID=UPI00243664BC|nr:cilia- and flagella-associated protein 57 [Periophthalmus magnuspinnatus]